MAFGMTQVGYLGSQAVKYFYMAVKFILGKIFNPSNITGPLKLMSKTLLGTDFRSREDKLKNINQGNLKLFESAWTLSQPSMNTPLKHGGGNSMILKLRRAIRSLIFLVVGLASGLALVMLKRRKDNQINDKTVQEQKLMLENQKLMKQAWREHQLNKINPKLEVSV
jgi:hypothetical protein